MSIIYRIFAFLLAIVSAMVIFFKTLPERIFGRETTTVITETTKLNGTEAMNSVDEILSFYNSTVTKTREGTIPEGKSQMKFTGEVTAANPSFANIMNTILKKAVVSETKTDYIPGNGAITSDDVVSCTATTNGTLTEIEFVIKGQTDGLNADPKEGPVGRAIGTLGNVNSALASLGATVVSGGESGSMEYKNVRVYCLVDNASGKIVKGEWSYDIDMNIDNMTLKISSLEVTLADFHTPMHYEVVI